MMDLEQLERKLNDLRSAGRINDDTLVMVRNPEVSSAAMEAGTNGWIEVDSVLVVNGAVYLEPEED